MILWLACKQETETTRTATNIGIAWKSSSSSNSNQNQLIKGILTHRVYWNPHAHSSYHSRIVSRVYNIISLLLICVCAKRYMERTWDRIVCPRAPSHSIRPPFPIRISKKKKKKRNNFTPFYSILFYCFYWRCESFECSRHQQPSPYRVECLCSFTRRVDNSLRGCFIYFFFSLPPLFLWLTIVNSFRCVFSWKPAVVEIACVFFFNLENSTHEIFFVWLFFTGIFLFQLFRQLLKIFKEPSFQRHFFLFHFWSEFFRTFLCYQIFFVWSKGKFFRKGYSTIVMKIY